MSKLFPLAVAAALAMSLMAPLLATPALANYSCEPGQPNCDPMPSPDLPQPDQPSNNQPHKEQWLAIACRVAGDPEARPNDLRFTNVGDVLIPAGTRVFWLLKQTGEHGSFLIGRDLPVGADVPDLDVLRAGLPPNTRCLSRLA